MMGEAVLSCCFVTGVESGEDGPGFMGSTLNDQHLEQ